MDKPKKKDEKTDVSKMTSKEFQSYKEQLERLYKTSHK
tara:strand:+ start:544 stop:657 length:114 start_codon:yes stop_codon:yes gene_type:complete